MELVHRRSQQTKGDAMALPLIDWGTVHHDLPVSSSSFLPGTAVDKEKRARRHSEFVNL
jgi:hypothetical protein